MDFWEPKTRLLGEKSEDYVEQLFSTTVWIEARQRESGEEFSRGAVTSSLPDNFGNGFSTFIPMEYLSTSDLYQDYAVTRLNLSGAAEVFLRTLDAAASDLFFHALSVMHTPTYRRENAGALLGDWPRIPLPAHATLLATSGNLGRRLSELLNAESSVRLPQQWSSLAALRKPFGDLKPEHLQLTAGWGSRGQGSTVMPGRGKAVPRPWTATERDRLAALAATQSLTLEAALTLLGDTCLDIYLNGDAFWSAVPANAWTYTLGGYQVLKKWLSYRELPLLGRALHPEESDYFAQVVRRIAAILLLGPALDASYAAILPTAAGLPS